MSKRKQVDLDVPYFVSAQDLLAIGVNPQPYFTLLPCETEDEDGEVEQGVMAGYILHRKNDAALIRRLQSVLPEHRSKQ